MSPKDPEKMVMATAKAMALANNSVGTPRVVKLHVDDAREVLLGVLKAAKHQKWELDDLLAVLDPPKPKLKPRDRHQGSPPLSSEP
jgi:hypothetical protein